MDTITRPTDDRALERDARLPGFIVFGTMRAGTTTLYHHLFGHPQIGMSRMKETDYFVAELNHPLGLDWYRSQFEPGFAINGEISPSYGMCHLWRGVPARIRETLPDVRLIFLARDPVDRFFSQYLHVWHVGHAKVPPEELLDSRVGRNILDSSRYAIQVEAYLEHFPREHLLLLDFDELRTEPQATLDRVTDFLGVDRHPVGTVATRNDTASAAQLPGFVQRVWRGRQMRHFDRFISRAMRDRVRRILSSGTRRPDPEISPELRRQVADLLRDDANAYRALSGSAFPNWKV